MHIDKNGDMNSETKEGIGVWLDTYDKMKADGATEEEARKAADRVKDKMDKVCSDGSISE